MADSLGRRVDNSQVDRNKSVEKPVEVGGIEGSLNKYEKDSQEYLEKSAEIFESFAGTLNLSPSLKSHYVEAFRKHKINILDFGEKFFAFKKILDKIPAGIYPDVEKNTLLNRAIGLLIYGKDQDFANLERFAIQACFAPETKRFGTEISLITKKMSALEKKLEQSKKVIGVAADNIAYYAENKPSKWNFFDKSFEKSIAGQAQMLQGQQEQMLDLHAQIADLKHEFITKKQALYESQFEMLRSLKVDQKHEKIFLTAVLFELGPEAMPQRLAAEFQKFVEREEVEQNVADFFKGRHGDVLKRKIEEYNKISVAEDLAETSESDEKDAENPDRKSNEILGNLMSVIGHNPDFKNIRETGEKMMTYIKPMEKIFRAGFDKEKTSEYVGLLKNNAGELLKLVSAEDIQNDLLKARENLKELKSLNAGRLVSELEKQVQKIESDLSVITDLLQSGQIEQFCNTILDSDFNADTFEKWLKSDLVILSFVILGAILVMSGVGLLVGVAGGGALLTVSSTTAFVVQSAAIGAGVLIGSEVGRTVSDFTFETGTESFLELYLNGKINGETLLKEYAIIFGLSAGSSVLFKFIGAQILKPLVDKMIANTASQALISETFKSLGQTIAKLGDFLRNYLDKISDPFRYNILKDFIQEMSEELLQVVAGNVAPSLDGVIKTLNAMDGQNVVIDFNGKYNIAYQSSKIESKRYESVFTYNPAKDSKQYIFSVLNQKYADLADFLHVSENADGVIVFEIKFKNSSLVNLFVPTGLPEYISFLYPHALDGKSADKQTYKIKKRSKEAVLKALNENSVPWVGKPPKIVVFSQNRSANLVFV